MVTVEVAHKIRQHCPDLPILLDIHQFRWKAGVSRALARLAELAGLIDFLVKPFQIGMLRTKINQLIGASA